MRRQAFFVSVVAIGLAYIASPYIALYRLDRAVRTGDAEYINAHVDWSSLRDGVVSQIGEAITGETSGAAAPAHDPSELPAFGSGFVHSFATHMVDKVMERDAMMSRIRQYAFARAAVPAEAIAGDGDSHPAEPVPASLAVPPMHQSLRWACFDGPMSFNVMLNLGAPGTQPVRLEMRLVDGVWEVTNARVPPALLMTADRT
jgi:hypothetical protein